MSLKYENFYKNAQKCTRFYKISQKLQKDFVQRVRKITLVTNPLALHRLSPQREEFDAHAVTVMKKRALKLHVF